MGIKLGLTYSPYTFAKLSATADFPLGITINEHGTTRTESLFVEGSAYHEDSGVVEEYSLSYPFTFGFGANLNFMFLNVAGDVVYTDWRQLEYKKPNWMLAENKYITDSYRSTWTYKIGVEGIVPIIGVSLRAGYAKSPIPYIDDQITDDREYVTFGGGVLLAKLMSLDFAAVFSGWEKENSTRNLTEKYKLTKFVAGLSYRF